ncbi:MAG: 50S ribosomal protein L28 [Planctomycetes bacterium]|nr:50S ribosomal protein L28 [Planctomycetota bacterium]
MAEHLHDKMPVRGRKYVRRGLAKAKGGVGRKITGKNKRWFRPNVQRVKIITANGTIKRAWVTAKMLKHGEVNKAPKQKILAQMRAEKAALKKK